MSQFQPPWPPQEPQPQPNTYSQPPYQPQSYSQPTGSFAPPPQPPKRKRNRLWLILGIVGGGLISCVLCGVVISAVASAGSPHPTASSTPTATTAPTQAVFVATDTPTLVPTLVPTEKPTPTATMKPTPTPTQAPIPTPRPTQPPPPKPTPTPSCQGVNGNPWCYNFSPGNLIYHPASAFCDYFSCVSTFWKDTNGYVVECGNGEYSHSGGVSGACSRDGGVLRTLYSH